MKLVHASLGLILTSLLASQAMAAKNAEVTFNARIVAATCDVSANKGLVNLGTHTIDSIKDISKAINTEKFNLVLNNCSKFAAEDSPVTDIELLASGNMLTGHDELFADAQASQVGVKISAENTVLKPNVTTQLEGIKVGESAGDIQIAMTAELIPTVIGQTLDAQQVNVPVTFSVAYN